MAMISFGSALLAQSKMIKLFNRLSKVDKQEFVITKKGKGFVADAGTGPVKVTVDDVNGFLEIVDNGTGGGSVKYQLAIFKDDKGKEVLAVNHYYFGDMTSTGALKFFRVSTKLVNVTDDKSVVSDWTVFTDKAIEDAGDFSDKIADVPPYTYYELPRKGKTIILHYGINGVDIDCSNNDEAACALKKKFKPVSMYWHKENGGYFSLKP